MEKIKKQAKKKFIAVEIPVLNREIELYGENIESFDKRHIKLNLANELHGKFLDLKLKVSADKNKAVANPIEAKILQSYMKKIVRKGTDYCEDSFKTECSNGKIKVQTFMVTRMRVTRKVLASLRKASKQYLIEYAKNKAFEDLILEILSNKLQRELNVKLKKVYPLNCCEIKLLSLVK